MTREMALTLVTASGIDRSQSGRQNQEKRVSLCNMLYACFVGNKDSIFLEESEDQPYHDPWPLRYRMQFMQEKLKDAHL